jgi:hypothetical protein
VFVVSSEAAASYERAAKKMDCFEKVGCGDLRMLD